MPSLVRLRRHPADQSMGSAWQKSLYGRPAIQTHNSREQTQTLSGRCNRFVRGADCFC